MILSRAYDIECLPNLFSITIVDVADYLRTFADCNDGSKKKRPVPLTRKYSVAEIKEKLESVRHKSFYIKDDDGGQLLPMLGCINNMRPYYDDNGVACRTDMFGYNSSRYDKLMTAALLMYSNQTDTVKELVTRLYETSKRIIETQNDPELASRDYLLSSLRKFGIPYVDVDVMRIFALNKVGKGVDDEGNTVYFGKSLKQTSINLQWYELLEYELPPITDKDAGYYLSKDCYKGMTCRQLNSLVNKWDRYILDEWIPDELHYNLNDVFIVCEMIRLYIDEIRLRYNVSKSYGVDVLNSSRSNIADRLFVKFYSEFSGLNEAQWRGKKTDRTSMAFSRVILPFIEFKTPELKGLLNEMKQVVVYSIGKKALKEIAPNYPRFKYLKTNNESGWFEARINNLVYTIATGGLHSKDIPRELRSKLVYMGNPSTGEGAKTSIWDMITDDSYILVHWDINSYYPSIMSAYEVAPAHLDRKVFTKLVTWLKDTRVAAKHSTEEYIDGIHKDLVAQALKIVINSIYGKLGSEVSDICDRLAVLKVTMNGQLMILMLCEELELAGIEVLSANTDGIVVKLYKRDKAKFDEIAGNWEKLTKLQADAEEYKVYVNRDINNYCIQDVNDKLSYKGDLNPFMYAVDLQKGYDQPVVAEAVVNYFIYGKPVLETLYECSNILDFCKTQNVGRNFHVEYTVDGVRKVLQRNVRFYVANKGGTVEKVNDITSSRTGLCSGRQVKILNTLDDMEIAYRNINYSYYYDEATKIIDPIKLQISPNQKANSMKKTKSGKVLIKKYSGLYNTLFDDEPSP